MAERYADLPEPVRNWLGELRKEDVDDISTIVKAWRRWQNVLWFLKWVGITIISSFMGTIALGESVVKAFAWLRGGH